MTKKDILSKIKSFFSETEEMKFVDLKTKDGLILRVENLEPEMTIQEVTEDGLVNLEDKTYELEDGLQLVVEGGVIKEIIEPEETEEIEETEVEEEMEVTDYSADINELKSEIATLKEMISKFELISTQLEELKQVKGDLEKSNEKFESLNLEFSEFKKSPTAKPIETKYDFKEIGLDAKLKQWKR